MHETNGLGFFTRQSLGLFVFLPHHQIIFLWWLYWYMYSSYCEHDYTQYMMSGKRIPLKVFLSLLCSLQIICFIHWRNFACRLFCIFSQLLVMISLRHITSLLQLQPLPTQLQKPTIKQVDTFPFLIFFVVDHFMPVEPKRSKKLKVQLSSKL